jgi:uncharacterized protein (TIGR02996 family)
MNEQAFLADVLDHPDDDAPRLVFADWLDENGDADRAEFIRAQIELARCPVGDPRHEEANQREWAIRQRYLPSFKQTLPGGRDLGHLRIRPWRGFGAIVYCTAGYFLKLGPRAFRVMPIQHAELYCVSPQQLSKLVRSRLLAKLRTLEIDEGGRDAAGARLLADCPHLAGLRELTFRGWAPFGEDGARALAGSPHLANLKVLRLRSDLASEKGVAILHERFGERLLLWDRPEASAEATGSGSPDLG